MRVTWENKEQPAAGLHTAALAVREFIDWLLDLLGWRGHGELVEQAVPVRAGGPSTEVARTGRGSGYGRW